MLISVKDKTASILKSLKSHHRDTYDDVILKLIECREKEGVDNDIIGEHREKGS